ncbi:hypothetical protein BT69DRAFT_1288227 [Atractiella rhizophila]|nr:hypothetical protein BT69DRAFT_1288227 [Atractiella rhizophila]
MHFYDDTEFEEKDGVVAHVKFNEEKETKRVTLSCAIRDFLCCADSTLEYKHQDYRTLWISIEDENELPWLEFIENCPTVTRSECLKNWKKRRRKGGRLVP